MTSPPEVSVVVIFHDEERFLPDAIASVHAQRFEAWELLLVDDGSRDGSAAIARAAAAAAPDRVRYLTHPGLANRGMSASRNLGIAAATAPLVAFLDGDDTYLPDRLGHHVALLAGEPAAGFAFGPLSYWYGWTGAPADQARDRVHRTHQPPFELLAPPRLFVDWVLGRSPTPNTCSLTVRRAVAAEVGGFEEGFRGMFEDQVFLYKVALHAPALVTDRALDRYRQHPGSTTALAARRGEWHPSDPRNAARRRFDAWLDEYLAGDVPHARTARRARRRRRVHDRADALPAIGPLHRRANRALVRRRRAGAV